MLLLAPPTASRELILLMQLEGVARRLDQRELLLCFALGLQRVDGRRFDAFVADLHCSRVHRGAARIFSYVSAVLVRVRESECASLPVVGVGVLVGVRALVRVCACVLASSRARGESPTGHCELRVLVQCSGLGIGTEGSDDRCSRQ